MAIVKHPLREALVAITGCIPELILCPDGAYDLCDIPKGHLLHLQDWCSDHARPEWATGISILEAAEDLVIDAVNNGSICPKKKPSDLQT